MGIQTEIVNGTTYVSGRRLDEIRDDLRKFTGPLVGREFQIAEGSPTKWPKHVEHVACYAIPVGTAGDARVFVTTMSGGAHWNLFVGLADNLEDGYRVAAACAAALNHR